MNHTLGNCTGNHLKDRKAERFPVVHDYFVIFRKAGGSSRMRNRKDKRPSFGEIKEAMI